MSYWILMQLFSLSHGTVPNHFLVNFEIWHFTVFTIKKIIHYDPLFKIQRLWFLDFFVFGVIFTSTKQVLVTSRVLFNTDIDFYGVLHAIHSVKVSWLSCKSLDAKCGCTISHWCGCCLTRAHLLGLAQNSRIILLGK